MWHQPGSASDRMAAHAHNPLVLGHANLVPRSCDPFEESEKKVHIWLAEKRIPHNFYANYFANHTNCEHVDLILTSHLGTHQFFRPLRKKFISIWFQKTTPQRHFVKSFLCLVIESRSMPLFNTCMLLNLSHLHTAVLILNTKKYMSSWLTNVSISAF